MRLLHTETRMNPKKIRRLMRKYELFCPVHKANPYRRLQKVIRTNNTAETLVNREFETHGPRSILLTDITYIPLNGAHYTSVKFVQLVKDGQLHQSMSRRANCWDNAPQESFFGHMKDEIDLSACTCFEQIHEAIRTWAD